MEYFLLSSKISDAGEFFAALDSSGTCLKNFSEAACAYFRVTTGAEICDKAPSIGNELILSWKASECLRAHSHFCSFMQSIPATFYRGALKHIVSDEYLLWWSSKQHNVLDMETSRIRYFKEQILTVDEWVLRRDLIPDCDIFLGPTNKWLVSSTFRNVCHKWNLTGFRFHPVAVK